MKKLVLVAAIACSLFTSACAAVGIGAMGAAAAVGQGDNGYHVREGRVEFRSTASGASGYESTVIVVAADRETFEVMRPPDEPGISAAFLSDYGRDKDRAYVRGAPIDGIDAATFRFAWDIDGDLYLRDERLLEYGGLTIADVDFATLDIERSPANAGSSVAEDARGCLFVVNGSLTRGPCPDRGWLSESPYRVNDGRVTWVSPARTIEVPADAASFEFIGFDPRNGVTSYGRDRDRVFAIASVVGGVDAASFRIATDRNGRSYLRDATSLIVGEARLGDVDFETFELEDQRYRPRGGPYARDRRGCIYVDATDFSFPLVRRRC